MRLLLDSDILIDLLNGKLFMGRIAELSNNQTSPSISVISYGEVLEGVFHSGRKQISNELFVNFAEGFNIYEVDLETARAYATIRGTLRRKGLRIADNDIWIAATALANDLTLVTRNERHYSRIPELRLVILD